MNTIATFITTERKKNEISMNELSKRSGVPYSTLAQIEKGRTIPQIVTAEKILDALGYELIFMRKVDLENALKNIKEIKDFS